jgi:hypothetical protein
MMAIAMTIVLYYITCAMLRSLHTLFHSIFLKIPKGYYNPYIERMNLRMRKTLILAQSHTVSGRTRVQVYLLQVLCFQLLGYSVRLSSLRVFKERIQTSSENGDHRAG